MTTSSGFTSVVTSSACGTHRASIRREAIVHVTRLGRWMPFTRGRHGERVLRAAHPSSSCSPSALIARLGVSGHGLPPTVGVSDHVLINELANGDAGSDADSFSELRNWGDAPVDLTGWHLFRCSPQGLRSNVGRPEADLTGVVLAAGAIFTISRSGCRATRTDPAVSIQRASACTSRRRTASSSTGRRLPERAVADPERVHAARAATSPTSSTSRGRELAARRRHRRCDPDFIVAPSTIGAANAAAPSPLAPTRRRHLRGRRRGPGRRDDEFVELAQRRRSTRSTSAGGRSTGAPPPAGSARTVELTIADGTMLAPGDLGRSPAPGSRATPTRRYDDRPRRRRVRCDAAHRVGRARRPGRGVGVPRQRVPGEDRSSRRSWMRSPPSRGSAELAAGSSRTRTPGVREPHDRDSVFRERVRLSRPARRRDQRDRRPTRAPRGCRRAAPAQLDRARQLRRRRRSTSAAGPCVAARPGRHARHRPAVHHARTGPPSAGRDRILAARAGTAAATLADATYDTALNFLGTGVWVADADGRPRRQRRHLRRPTRWTAATSPRAPARRASRSPPTSPTGCWARPSSAAGSPGSTPTTSSRRRRRPARSTSCLGSTRRTGRRRSRGRRHRSCRPDGRSAAVGARRDGRATVREAWGGVVAAPLTDARRATTRSALTRAAGLTRRGYGFPYQRLVIDAAARTGVDRRAGPARLAARNEVQLSVWNSGAWRLLVRLRRSGRRRRAASTGSLRRGRHHRRRADPAGPGWAAHRCRRSPPTSTACSRTPPTTTSRLAHHRHAVPDRELPRRVRAAGELDRRQRRRPQDRVRHPHRRPRAELGRPRPERDPGADEFERASAIQTILEDAGVRNSVLPGNHDNKRGVSTPCSTSTSRRRATTAPLVRRFDRAGRQLRELLDLRVGGREVPHAVAAVRVRRSRADLGRERDRGIPTTTW